MTHSAIRLHAHRHGHPARRRTHLDTLRARPAPGSNFWRGVAIGAPAVIAFWGVVGFAIWEALQ